MGIDRETAMRWAEADRKARERHAAEDEHDIRTVTTELFSGAPGHRPNYSIKLNTVEETDRQIAEELDPKPGDPNILQDALHRVVTAPDDYGPPGKNADNTADMWNAYVERRTGVNPNLTGRDVGLMMVLLKVSRDANRPKRDNLVDIAGWAGVSDKATDR